MSNITKEQRDKFYKMQCEALHGSNPVFGKNTAFCSRDFRCWHCNRDLLDHLKTLEDAEKGQLITGCPFCNHSFCE